MIEKRRSKTISLNLGLASLPKVILDKILEFLGPWSTAATLPLLNKEIFVATRSIVSRYEKLVIKQLQNFAHNKPSVGCLFYLHDGMEIEGIESLHKLEVLNIRDLLYIFRCHDIYKYQEFKEFLLKLKGWQEVDSSSTFVIKKHKLNMALRVALDCRDQVACELFLEKGADVNVTSRS